MVRDAILQAFGKRVRLRRIELELSQEELAEISGFHRTYIGAIERGERNPSLLSISRLAKSLDIDVGTLIERVSSKTSKGFSR